MGKSLKCDLCSKPATVHLTQIINNQIHKLDLCEECAAAKGVTDPNGFSLADLLVKSPSGQETSGTTLTCPSCGFTQADFKRLGRLGCPDCYDTFQSILSPVLGNMHKGTTHVGKVPHRALARQSMHEKITRLEEELQKAVEAERYEDAAKFRDEIQALKQSNPEESATT